MNREQKIDLLKGLEKGTLSIKDLNTEPEINYDLLTFSEFLTFGEILYPDHYIGYSGQHVSTKVFTEAEIKEVVKYDVSKRIEIKVTKRSIVEQIWFETIHYKGSSMDSKTHISFHGVHNTLSVFPSNDELIKYQQMEDRELTAHLKKLFDENINWKLLL